MFAKLPNPLTTLNNCPTVSTHDNNTEYYQGQIL